MLDVLSGFLGELRAAGVPISVRESIDAALAATAVGLDNRETLKSALSASVVKSPDHRAAFHSELDVPQDDIDRSSSHQSAPTRGEVSGDDQTSITPAELTALALAALESGEMAH